MSDIETAEVPSGCWGIDLSAKLDYAQIRRIMAEPLLGHQIRFVWRYVRLPGNSPAGDIDREELENWLSEGAIVLLVQHCRGTPWQAFGVRGSQDGAAAALHATLAGYPAGGRIALDLEDVANPGQDVIAHCNEWAASVRAAGFEPALYVGFDCGLSPDELFHSLTVDRYWSDFGPRSVSVRGFCCKQYQQIRIAGVDVDPNHAFADALGGVLVGAARAELPTNPDLPAA